MAIEPRDNLSPEERKKRHIRPKRHNLKHIAACGAGHRARTVRAAQRGGWAHGKGQGHSGDV